MSIMGTRIELQLKLEEILGSRHVYFQPPASIKMTYPAIVYELDFVQGPKAEAASHGVRSVRLAENQLGLHQREGWNPVIPHSV